VAGLSSPSALVRTRADLPFKRLPSAKGGGRSTQRRRRARSSSIDPRMGSPQLSSPSDVELKDSVLPMNRVSVTRRGEGVTLTYALVNSLYRYPVFINGDVTVGSRGEVLSEQDSFPSTEIYRDVGRNTHTITQRSETTIGNLTTAWEAWFAARFFGAQ
jgi:hypothetical protein